MKDFQWAAGNPFPTQQNGRSMDRPTVRPNSNIVAAHLRSATARMKARIKINLSASVVARVMTATTDAARNIA
jgi:hypothetical protein